MTTEKEQEQKPKRGKRSIGATTPPPAPLNRDRPEHGGGDGTDNCPVCDDYPCRPGCVGYQANVPVRNAGSGVVDDDRKAQTAGEIRDALGLGTFYIAETGLLPPPGENDPGALADIFFASGYFGDLTPAQIAVHIIAGRSLGLDDAQSVFDLEIGPGPTIRYRQARTYEQASDDIAELKAELKRVTTAADIADRPDLATPETALKARDSDPGAVKVVDFPGGSKYEISAAAAASLPEPENLANKGPLTDLDTDRPAEQAETPGNADDTQERAGFGDDPGPEFDQKPELEPVTPPGALPPAVGAAGDETLLVVQTWRAGLVEMCNELGIKADEKTSTFDAGSFADKRKMFEDCQKYYAGKIDAARTFVMESLAADGKAAADAQKGFYLFADVPTDPDEWTLKQALKARAALTDFLSTKPAA